MHILNEFPPKHPKQDLGRNQEFVIFTFLYTTKDPWLIEHVK